MGRHSRQSTFRDQAALHSAERAQWHRLLSPELSHGGPPSRKKRKTKRPFFSNVPQIFVLSSVRARKTWSLSHRRRRSRIQGQIHTYAKRFRIKVYQSRILPGQIQLLVKASDRKDLADFFRVLAGRVAVTVSGAKKGIRRIGRFWNELCWSKMLNWGADFHEVALHLKTGRVDPENRTEGADSQTLLFPALDGG